MKEKGICESHLKKIKDKKKFQKKERREKKERTGDCAEVNFFFSFSLHFFLRFMKIGPSEFVGRRTKVLYEMRATRGYQKHGISQRIQVKNSGNPNF